MNSGLPAVCRCLLALLVGKSNNALGTRCALVAGWSLHVRLTGHGRRTLRTQITAFTSSLRTLCTYYARSGFFLFHICICTTRRAYQWRRARAHRSAKIGKTALQTIFARMGSCCMSVYGARAHQRIADG